MKAVTKPLVQKDKVDASELSFTEKLVSIDRVAKVVKGGKRLNFRALVVVGNGEGIVGAGIGKAREVPEAVRKAGVEARKNLIKVSLAGTTIPHEVMTKYGATKVLLKPAVPGTWVIAAGGTRALLEVAGVKDILTKSLSSSNSVNVVKATLLGLASLRDPKEAVTRRKAEPEVVEVGRNG